ncbi:glycerol-3-phosphate acyltransferase [candidate division WOR-3 bacterium]|nr:glycerol-3-phosphate acyltransferase [candidate division WOR-3 bacterium]
MDSAFISFIQNEIVLYIIIFLLSYLIGDIPFAFILPKLVKKVDIRYEGEGNVGARNVLHTIGKSYGILVGLLDFSKGFVVALICLFFRLPFYITFIAGFAAVLGHDFPIFLKFKGGKGVATALGFLFGLFPIPTFATLFLMLITFSIKRYYLFAMVIGIGSLPVLWLPLFKHSIKEITATVIFLSFLGIKRIIDTPHMRKVREASGWDKR